MKKTLKQYFILLLLGMVFTVQAQHSVRITASVDNTTKTISVYQEITFHNSSTTDTINHIVFNDWNNAYSAKDTPLAKRFSDEYIRNFHLANQKERGSTNNLTITDEDKFILNWCRYDNYPDLVELHLNKPILPLQNQTFVLTYILKIPNARFTDIGYNKDEMILKNCFLIPSRFDNGNFVKYENLNIDDQTNALCTINLKIHLPSELELTSNLVENKKETNIYELSGKNILNINLYLEKKSTFSLYRNNIVDVWCNIKDQRVNPIQKAVIIDKIVNYVATNISYPIQNKIVVSENDYQTNPFYGLNQLPSFLSPFPDDFIYELKFLKTYLNSYLKNALQIDCRKDNWIFDAIQVYHMMKYIDQNYPNAKMMGSIAKIKLLKGYHLVSLDFNEQYNYFYMLMARQNLDQSLGAPKNELLRFNDKIASKYRAGLSFKYLADYIGEETLEQSIAQFVQYASKNQTDVTYFEKIITTNTSKNIDWFFKTIINSRAIIDYKFANVTKSSETVSFSLVNKTNVFVPIPVYGIKNKQIVFKEWIDQFKTDSIYTLKRNNAEKLVINYKNVVPEFNQRNNWHSLKSFFITHKPIKFNFMKDLEDPNYNQVLYVPDLDYNLYDGAILGLRFHNKTLLNRPFYFDVTPSYSTNTQSFSGSFSLSLNRYHRDKKLFYSVYGISGRYYHYAPDATYQRFTPYITFKFRDNNNFRKNYYEALSFREVYVNKEPSAFLAANTTIDSSNQTYAVFDARYAKAIAELSHSYGYSTNFQFSGKFSKIIGEASFRKLFNDNRQFSARLYLGLFLHNNTSDNSFTFALDRPNDYLFDYNYFGRSENSGFFSQQFITADGGFKSIFKDKYANTMLTAVNLSGSIWNWVECYGNVGLLQSKDSAMRFAYDSGIRLNLVQGYLEIYLPVQSTNGFEITQPHYSQKIRFILAFSTKSFMGLFTRKWF